MTPNELIGWFAASLVFAAFCAREMAALRAVAIASNIAFIGYGYIDHLWPIVVLHTAMLPMNVIRLSQALSSVGGATRSHQRRRDRAFALALRDAPAAMNSIAAHRTGARW
jgi:hypothetical protein